MSVQFRKAVAECSAVSDAGTMNFAGVVKKLMDAGVERYHADLVRSEKTYFRPDGESETVSNESLARTPAATFSAPAVEAAVRAVQAGAIDYKAFCRRVMDAGCVGYLVSIAGRRVVYYGRTGENHVEYFPDAN